MKDIDLSYDYYNKKNINESQKNKNEKSNLNLVKSLSSDLPSPKLYINNIKLNIKNYNSKYKIYNIKTFKEDNENKKLSKLNNEKFNNSIIKEYNKNNRLFHNDIKNKRIDNYNIKKVKNSLNEIHTFKIKEEEEIRKKMGEKLPFKPTILGSLEEIQNKFFKKYKKKFNKDKKDKGLKIGENNTFQKLNFINLKFKEYEESKMKIISQKVEEINKNYIIPDFAIYLKILIDKNSNRISPEEKDYLNSIYKEMLFKIYKVDEEKNINNVIKGYEEIMNNISIILFSLKIQNDYIPQSYFDKFKKYNYFLNKENKYYIEKKKNDNLEISNKYKFLISQYKELGIKENEYSMKYQRKTFITAFLFSFILVILMNIIWNN